MLGLTSTAAGDEVIGVPGDDDDETVAVVAPDAATPGLTSIFPFVICTVVAVTLPGIELR